MSTTKPYDSETDRTIIRMYEEEGRSFQQIAYRIGRSPDGVGKRYKRLKNSGIDREYLNRLHRLAIGFKS